MPAASLLTLLDDIAAVLDDVAVMTKVAARKTAGVLGDDLALNAQQVAGVHADRELPVVWAVARGSLRNKVILVPAALLISAFAPWGVTPLLMAGGAFLCFEGFEKLAHARDPGESEAAVAPAGTESGGSVENDKIKGAVRTDFILSAEIIAITLGVVAGTPLIDQVAVLSLTAVGMTLGVYGLVAAIVKLDDGGLALSRRSGDGAGAAALRAFGRFVVAGAPWLMKTLSVAGTAAMFLVGGGILLHGIAPLHGPVEALVSAAAALPGIGPVAAALAPTLLNAVAGVVAGAVVYAVVAVAKRALRRR